MNEKLARMKRLEEEKKLSEISQTNKNTMKFSLNINEILDAKSSITSNNSYENKQSKTSKTKLPPIEQTTTVQEPVSTVPVPAAATHKLEIIEHEENELDKLTKNNYFSVDEIMSENMQLDNFKPHLENEFGSFQYTIRSRHLLENSSFYSDDDESEQNGDSDGNNDQKFTRHNQLKPILSQSFTVRKKKKHHNFGNSNSLELINNYNSKSNHLNYNHSFKLNKLNHTFDNEGSVITTSQFAYSSSYLNQSNLASKPRPYEYNKITNDIYKIFGRTKQAISYPQQISNLNKIGKIQGNNNNSSSNSIDKILNLKDALSIFSDDATSAKQMLNYTNNHMKAQSEITDISKYLIKKQNNSNHHLNEIGQNQLKMNNKSKLNNNTTNNFASVTGTPT